MVLDYIFINPSFFKTNKYWIEKYYVAMVSYFRDKVPTLAGLKRKKKNTKQAANVAAKQQKVRVFLQ